MQRAVIRWDVERRREVGMRVAVVVCNYASLRGCQPRRPRSLDIDSGGDVTSKSSMYNES